MNLSATVHMTFFTIKQIEHTAPVFLGRREFEHTTVNSFAAFVDNECDEILGG